VSQPIDVKTVNVWQSLNKQSRQEVVKELQLVIKEIIDEVLSGRSASDRTSQRRFLREVRLFTKLSHPNIISAFDARLEGELLYLVTEWVQGEDLANLVTWTGDRIFGLFIINSTAEASRWLMASTLLLRSVARKQRLVNNRLLALVTTAGLWNCSSTGARYRRRELHTRWLPTKRHSISAVCLTGRCRLTRAPAS